MGKKENWNALRSKWKDARSAGDKAKARWGNLRNRMKDVTDPDGRKAAARKNWANMKDNMNNLLSAAREEESDDDLFADTDELEASLEAGADPDSLIGSEIWLNVEKDLLAKGICASQTEAEGWIVHHIEQFLSLMQSRDLHRYAVTPHLAEWKTRIRPCQK